MTGVAYRKAAWSDASHISAMMSRYVDHPWTEAQVKEEIDNPNALFFVATVDNAVVGFLSGVCAADECEISDIAVELAYRRQKVASELFKLLLSDLEIRGIRAAYLLVRENNLPAASLYEKLGFKAVGMRKGYYNGAGAVIMRKEL